MLKRLSLGNTLPLGDTLPQFLASDCISGICEEHFLDNILVLQKMVVANSSKPDTYQKLWQGVWAGAGRRKRGCSSYFPQLKGGLFPAHFASSLRACGARE